MAVLGECGDRGHRIWARGVAGVHWYDMGGEPVAGRAVAGFWACGLAGVMGAVVGLRAAVAGPWACRVAGSRGW
ncbi:hypothetical protein GCM10020218_078890 [Dactylosporangium vinaceum]